MRSYVMPSGPQDPDQRWLPLRAMAVLHRLKAPRVTRAGSIFMRRSTAGCPRTASKNPRRTPAVRYEIGASRAPSDEGLRLWHLLDTDNVRLRMAILDFPSGS